MNAKKTAKIYHIPQRDTKKTTGYRFKNKSAIMNVIVAYINNDTRSIYQIAKDTHKYSYGGVAGNTINNWCLGKTFRPQEHTLSVVAATIGLEIGVWEKATKRRVL